MPDYVSGDDGGCESLESAVAAIRNALTTGHRTHVCEWLNAWRVTEGPGEDKRQLTRFIPSINKVYLPTYLRLKM